MTGNAGAANFTMPATVTEVETPNAFVTAVTEFQAPENAEPALAGVQQSAIHQLEENDELPAVQVESADGHSSATARRK